MTTIWLHTFFEILCSTEEANSYSFFFFNNLSKWWQNYIFWVNYPFNICSTNRKLILLVWWIVMVILTLDLITWHFWSVEQKCNLNCDEKRERQTERDIIRVSQSISSSPDGENLLQAWICSSGWFYFGSRVSVWPGSCGSCRADLLLVRLYAPFLTLTLKFTSCLFSAWPAFLIGCFCPLPNDTN